MTETTAWSTSVFVYGTLLPGYGNHAWIDEAYSPIATPALLPDFALLGFGMPYPYAVSRHGQTTTGAILTFDESVWDAALHDLDGLEGEGSLYDRIRVRVITDDGRRINAWTYTPTAATRASREDRLVQVPGNDWHNNDRLAYR